MSFSTAGVQTGTDTDLSGMSSITGHSSVTVNGFTTHTITTQLTVSGTLSYDATVEKFVCSGSNTEQLLITGTGTLTIYGGLTASSFGSGGRLDSIPTCMQLALTGTMCCSNGSVAIEDGGRWNLYGVRVDLDSVLAWESGSGGIIRDSIIFCRTVPTTNTTRIRVSGAENWDIQGLQLFNIQLDWLTDEAFIANSGIVGNNAGLPIENATGTSGATRLWRGVKDPRPTADAFGNNWNGLKNLILELCEAGSGTMIVPDSVNGTTSGTGHGGLIYHEYNVTVEGSSSVDGKCFIRDTDNGNRRTMTVPTTIWDTDQDQFLITTITAGVSTETTDILVAHWYRSNSVSDLAAPDGNEIVDARGKNDVTEVVADDDDRDLFDAHFKGLDWLYGAAPDTVMRGLVATEIFFGVLEDTGRDSDSAATIAAYTSCVTSTKAYNAMKAWSIEDANLEIPSSSTFIFEASGVHLTATGAYDITFSPGTDSDPFQFTAPDVTIFTGAGMVGSFETTGSMVIEASTAVSGSTFIGNVVLNSLEDLTDVVIEGDLEIDLAAGAADITRVGQTEAVSTGEDDEITIAFPSGIKDDDFALIAVGHAQSGENTWNTPSGWAVASGLTEVQTGGTPVSTPGVTVFQRVLDTDSGSVTITNSGTNTSGIVAQMIVYRGVDTTNPLDVTPVTATGASGDPDPASITPTNNDCMIVAFGFQDHGDQTTPTPPSGYTAILDTATTDGAGTGET